MHQYKSKESLIDFERKVADTFNNAEIKAPIHFMGIMKLNLLIFLRT